jgi:hypothetical protein
MKRLPELACGLTGLVFGTVLAVALSTRSVPVPGMHLAVFPPFWNAERILGAIVETNAIPVAATKWPGAWVVHLPPGGGLPGALTTNSETLLALTGACASQ